MKKTSTIVLSLLMVFTLFLGLTGCGETITLASQSVNGVSLDVPSDFGAFAEKSGVMLAVNADSTASISIGAKGDAKGIAPSDWDSDAFTQYIIPNYTDVNFVEFDTTATVGGASAVYAHYTCKNTSGVPLESYNYILYFDDGTSQSVALSFNTDASTSLQQNIDTVKNSIKFS